MIEELAEGVTVVGTAHVAQSSVDAVEETIRRERPQKVLVELDQRRFEALQDPDSWQNTDIIEVIRQNKQHMFLLQLYLAAMQAQMGKETGVSPGGEMLKAIQVADEIGAEVVLVDRDVSITLRRGFGSMNFWQRLRLFWKVWMQILTPAEEGEEMDVEEMLETDAITRMTEEFAQFAPQIKTALIDERDEYMASHILEQAESGSVVAVVGAGHMAGIRRYHATRDTRPRQELDQPPKKKITVGKVLAFLIPLGVIGSFIYFGVTGDTQNLRDNLLIWIIANGTLAALGAIIARGHILSIITAFVAAPLTSLNPLLAAGWFAGLMEAKVHTPTVKDFQAIKGIETLREFWRNDVVRVLLVTALANLGSAIGTWIGLAEIIKSILGVS